MENAPPWTPSPPQAAASERLRELLLELQTRRLLFERIAAVPGIHLRRLAREVGLSLGTVEPQVHQLERHGVIVSHRQGRRRSLFLANGFDPQDLQCLHLLRNRSLRRILLELLEAPEVSCSHLVSRLPLEASTISYHLRTLVESGMVRCLRVGRSRFYALVDPHRFGRLLSTYGSTFRALPPNPTPATSLEPSPALPSFEH